MREVDDDAEHRAVDERDDHRGRRREAVARERHAVRQHDDGKHELARGAQLREAVGAEHRHRAVREVHDARRLVLADDTDGEQAGDRAGTEAEQDEEQDRLIAPLASAELHLRRAVVPLVRQVDQLVALRP